MTMAGNFAGRDTRTIAVATPSPTRQVEPGMGRVVVLDAGGANLTATLVDDDGGAPCVLNATRIGIVAARILPGQTCADSQGGVAMTVTVSSGAITLDGATLTLNFVAAFAIAENSHGHAGAISGTLSYDFTGARTL